MTSLYRVMKSFFSKLSLSLTLLLLPSITLAQAPTDFKSLLLLFVRLINLFIPALFAIALVLVSWGAFKYLQKGSERSLEEARNLIIYGILGIAVMASVWGLVAIIENTFFPTTASEGVYRPNIKGTNTPILH